MLKHVCLFALVIALVAPIASAQLETPKTPAETGLTVLVPDTILFAANRNNSNNWEPYASVLGDGTFLVVSNTFAADDLEPGADNSSERAAVALIAPDGKITEVAGFYDDAGNPWVKNMDNARKDGNPARVYGDTRPGGVRYIVANEATAWAFPEFATYQAGTFGYDVQSAVVQIFEKTSTGVKPITKAFDPIHGKATGSQGGQQVRFGGDVRVLSNGNFLVVVEDRTKAFSVEDRAIMAAIVDASGNIVKAPFNLQPDGARVEIWSNVAAYKDGFAVRLAGIIYFYDNAGNLKGSVDQGEVTLATDRGRGDGTRIDSNLNSKYIYMVGNDTAGGLGDSWISKIDTTTFQQVAERSVNELLGQGDAWDYFPKSDRHNLAVDANDYVICTVEDDIGTGQFQTVARIFDNQLRPVTSTFLAFSSSVSDTSQASPVHLYRVSPAMSASQILVAGKGEIPVEGGAMSPTQSTIAVVLKHPNAPAPVLDWSVF